MAVLDITASQRNHYMYEIAKVLLLVTVIAYYIKNYVQLGIHRLRFLKFWKAFGSFSISYCVSLLFAMVIP